MNGCGNLLYDIFLSRFFQWKGIQQIAYEYLLSAEKLFYDSRPRSPASISGSGDFAATQQPGDKVDSKDEANSDGVGPSSQVFF